MWVYSAGGAAIDVSDVDRSVWRLGREPSPWCWVDWKWADPDHGFDGRWDDPNRQWRALYVSETRLGCFLECLAHLRAEPGLAAELAEIDDDQDHPTLKPGQVPGEWCTDRIVGKARMRGVFAVPAASRSLAELRKRFFAHARAFGLHDVDAAALRLPSPRAFTQQIADWIYGLHADTHPPLDGIQYRSRHGDEHLMWAVYERQIGQPSACLDPYRSKSRLVDWEDADLQRAMELFGLSWAPDPPTSTSCSPGRAGTPDAEEDPVGERR